MLEMMLVGGNNKRLLSRPVGQKTYNVGGSYTFVVPKDVVSISVALVGAALSNGKAGAEPSEAGDLGLAGGGSMYMNNIAVTPGQVIQLQVGRIGYTSSTTDYNHITMSKFQQMAVGYGSIKQQPALAVGFNGGRGGYDSSTRILIGGSAGSFVSGGNNGQATIENFYAEANKPGGWDSDLTTYTQPSPGTPVALYGAGGIRYSTTWRSLPQGGVVRIIWGNGRSFPNRLITDQPVKDAVWG